jgi:hypothetical protein
MAMLGEPCTNICQNLAKYTKNTGKIIYKPLSKMWHLLQRFS